MEFSCNCLYQSKADPLRVPMNDLIFKASILEVDYVLISRTFAHVRLESRRFVFRRIGNQIHFRWVFWHDPLFPESSFIPHFSQHICYLFVSHGFIQIWLMTIIWELITLLRQPLWKLLHLCGNLINSRPKCMRVFSIWRRWSRHRWMIVWTSHPFHKKL